MIRWHTTQGGIYMCTAISFQTKDHYFGRNLDLERSYIESVTITSRNYPFPFRREKEMAHHFAMIGMAAVVDGYPLYYDATNEKGLSMAGLNFPGNAAYLTPLKGKTNLSPFEFIPWVLGMCESVADARNELDTIRLVDIPFSDTLGLSPLHWILCDKERSVTIEPTPDGLRVYDNPVGVLTNNPPFDYHMQNLANYLNLTREEPKNRFSAEYELQPYSRGMGAIGLPGDLSSSSRFVRAAFTKLNSVCKQDELSSVSQFFHILGAVAQQEGCVKAGDSFEKTVYSSCCNTDKCIYYYTTYENRQITGVELFAQDLDINQVKSFPLVRKQQIRMENRR